MGNFLGGSIYHLQMHADNIPFLPNQPPPALNGLLARAAMATEVITVSRTESKERLREILEVCLCGQYHLHPFRLKPLLFACRIVLWTVSLPA